jgi:hypothetical protein
MSHSDNTCSITTVEAAERKWYKDEEGGLLPSKDFVVSEYLQTKAKRSPSTSPTKPPKQQEPTTLPLRWRPASQSTTGPLGLDPFVFNSKIRRRNLDDLIDRLVEEGKAHWPSAGEGLASVKEEEAEPAQTPATPTTAIVAVGSAVPAVTQIDK